MIAALKSFIKRNKFAYHIYYRIGSALLRFCSLFIRTDPHTVLFISYGGKKYDDSPRAVYEYMRRHSYFKDFRLVWAFTDPAAYSQVPEAVKVDTPAYFFAALRAGFWITNSSASRGLNFKKPSTKYYLYEHGMTCLKRIGTDILQAQKAYGLDFQEHFHAVFIEGLQEIPILAQAWHMDPQIFHPTGLPRNDDLCNLSADEQRSLKAQLGIPPEKRVILYAPTFRESSRSPNGQNALSIPFHFDRWATALGQSYVLLVTAHYEVAHLLDSLPKNEFVYNCFQYPILNDLLKVADVLISDYSSIVFDYSILERPIFCYGYDYSDYKEERGFYTDPSALFSHGVIENEDALLNAICSMDYQAECAYTKSHIKEPYLASYGNATAKSVQIMFPDMPQQ